MESGILCSITHTKPNFEEECKDFDHDLSREEKIKNDERKEVFSFKGQKEEILIVPTSVKVLGWIEIVFSSIILLTLGILSIYTHLKYGTRFNFLVIMTSLFFISGFILNGIYLRRGSSISRNITAILSAIRLIGLFPIGLIWGSFAIYYLIFNENVKKYYASKK